MAGQIQVLVLLELLMRTVLMRNTFCEIWHQGLSVLMGMVTADLNVTA
jgi:hypothetical protein